MYSQSPELSAPNMSKQQLITDIVAFFEKSLENNEVTEDERESLELAVGTIRDAYQIQTGQKANDLLEIYRKGNTIAAPVSSDAEKVPSPVAVSEEDKVSAEELKAEGNKFISQHKFKEAADAYTEAIEKNPNVAMYYSNRAAAFSRLNLNARALEDARRATELDPNFAKGWTRLGQALLEQGDAEEAVKAYQKSLDLQGDSPSELTKNGFAAANKKLAELGNTSVDSASDTTSRSAPDAGTGAGAGAGGSGFDFSQLSSLMSNPQIRQMASNFMSNPGALKDLMNSPMAQQMKESMRNGNMPNLDDLNGMMGGK